MKAGGRSQETAGTGMYKVTVRPGHTLWEELEEQDIVIDRPCGGRGTCGLCSVVLADGSRVRACQYKTAGEVAIRALPAQSFYTGTPAKGQTADAAEVAGNFYAETPVAAADIGTTTVALVLFWRDRCERGSFVNPQRRYGADVMSRIQAANEGHLAELKMLLRESLKNELKQLYEKLRGSLSREACCELECFGEGMGIGRLAVSANTTMQHLLEGRSCERLGVSPFVPGSLALRSFPMDGIEVVQLPGISAFVGADIVSGLALLDILHRSRPALFVDLGTNGEMALGCRRRLIAASAAAGPAFEGSGPALALHGAGVLKLLHELLEQGIVDEYGTLCEAYFDTGYPLEDLRLTQEDIRALQMAKAAVRVGVEMLLKAYGVDAEQVEQVYLAGGFGHYLDPEDALAVGLLPECFRGRITAVGNTSLEGAAAYVRAPGVYGERMEEICRRAEVLTLPDCEGFEECYIGEMNFGLYSDRS